MKKTLALFMAVLVALSMFSVAAFAADNLVTVKFMNGDVEVATLQVNLDVGGFSQAMVPENPTAPADAEEGYKYTFDGWQSSLDGKKYYKGTIGPITEDVTYTATFAAEKEKPTQSLLNFFESIFERINRIFQYFAEIFRFDQ